MTRFKLLYFVPLLGGLAATPASAGDLGGGFAVSGGASLVSDYRFRGISQTNKHFAVQGTFTVSHSSGFYGTFWGSSIDDYIASGADAEFDLIVGYKKTFKSTTIDGGLLYYVYPGAAHGTNTNFAEPYIHITQAFGPLSLTGTAAYAPKSKSLTVDGIHSEDNLYLAGDLAYAIPKTPVSLTGHFGHSFGPSYLTIGKEYSDWSLGVSVTYKNLTAGVQYVDTDKTAFSPQGHDISGAGVVGTVGVSF